MGMFGKRRGSAASKLVFWRKKGTPTGDFLKKNKNRLATGGLVGFIIITFFGMWLDVRKKVEEESFLMEVGDQLTKNGKSFDSPGPPVRLIIVGISVGAAAIAAIVGVLIWIF